MKIIIDIKKNDRIPFFMEMLKGLDYIGVEEVDQTSFSLTKEQQNILDKRRASAKDADFIPWNKAKKELKYKNKK